MSLPTSPKSLVRTFYRDIIAARDSALAAQLIAPAYIQHNPLVETGLQGVLNAIAYLKQFPSPPAGPSPIKRILEDGPFVGVHMLVAFGGYEQVVMDIFRLEDGLLAEHWDAIQPLVSPIPSGHSMVDGDTEIRDRGDTEQNKDLVRQYFEAICIPHQAAHLDTFVGNSLIQHHPAIANGAAGLEAFFDETSSYRYEEVHRMIGEGNFVLAQSSGQLASEAFVFYDLFRLEAGLIVEQWNVSQAIPAEMAHDNGML